MKRNYFNNLGSFRFILILIFILLIFVGWFFFFYSFENEAAINSCGDKTSYGNCSKIQPYFCDDGFLIAKASVCGCSNLKTREGETCISKYQTEPKKISLNYTLNGVHKKIDFLVYKGLSDYLFGLPVFLSGNNLSRGDFKLRNINNLEQRELLLPLVVAIQDSEKNELDQVRTAISIVQNIPYNSSGKKLNFVGAGDTEYQRYPYETLYDFSGLCGEKTELLSFLLKELGYGSASFYYKEENHEAAGIKCPVSESIAGSGYCFIETTGPAILTDDKEEYFGVGVLESTPEIFVLSEGNALDKGIDEYSDADKWITLNRKIKTEQERMSISNFNKWKFLVNKYGLEIPDFLSEIVRNLESK